MTHTKTNVVFSHHLGMRNAPLILVRILPLSNQPVVLLALLCGDTSERASEGLLGNRATLGTGSSCLASWLVSGYAEVAEWQRGSL